MSRLLAGSSGRTREPAINLPLPVTVAIGLLIAIHGVRSFLSDETDFGLIMDLAFFPAQWSVAWTGARVDEVIRAASAASQDAASRAVFAEYVVGTARPHLWSWLSYAVLHGSWLHVGVNSVWLAAFGAPIVRRVGTLRSAVLALVTAIGGAAAQWLADPMGVQPMIGASACVSGFMAAAATFMFQSPGRRGRWGFLIQRGPLLFLAAWFAANLLFGFLATPLGLSDGPIAWEAHIGGLIAGLALFPLLDQPDRGHHLSNRPI